ncbi:MULTISPECIES: energy-coupling factor transporter transmembrane component T family protein [Aliagarivorans]|uniref:energy-coupling factor transporter transmembrane component T family protein n=1 Tax=Aliagarivorans TaxID=882379 RepID=UPI0004059632|nr:MULTISPECIES: energy-coupling factor transporter transmembrane component T [Aliagarivorans]
MISLSSPVETRAHRWPAGVKLALLSVTTLGLFLTNNPLFHAVILLAVITLYALPGKVFFLSGCRHLRILAPFIVILMLWHGLSDDLAYGATITMRLVSAVSMANLLTMTTRLTDMMEVVRFLARPLRRLGLNPRVLELSMALVIRMTPTLVSRGKTLSQAWRARSNRRSGWRIILPFTVLALDDADHVAQALRARGGLIDMEDE